MENFRCAVFQMCSGPNKAENLAATHGAAQDAARAGAQLLALPEVFSYRDHFSRERAQAEPIPGPTTDQLAEIAQETGLWISAGSLLEDVGDEVRVANTSILIAPNGAISAQYRKIHLFDIEIPGRVEAQESAFRIPGHETVVAPTPLARFGLSVCYDLRFPELYRAQASAGAEVLLVPAAFTATTGDAHWEVLVRARAIENQCFVIAAGQYGESPHGHRCHGHSLVVDPWGRVLASAGAAEELLVADLDASTLVKFRARLPVLEHRRLP